MSKWVGRRGELGIARETTRGTAVSPTASVGFWIPRNTISFQERTETALEEQGLGIIADSDSRHFVQRMGEGEIEAELYDRALGLILTSLTGTVPTTTGSDPYTHSYTLANDNQHDSISILSQNPDDATMFPLGVVDSLNMVVEQNATVKWTAGFKSRGPRDWTRQTTSYTTVGNKFLHQHLQFKLAASVGALAAASVLSLKRLEVTFATNTIFDSILGTVEPEDILNQQFSVEGTIELNREDRTYRNYMLDGTYRAMEIKLNRSTSSTLTIQLPRCSFFEWEEDKTLNEIAGQTIQFKGHYDAANALEIISTLELINSQSSY